MPKLFVFDLDETLFTIDLTRLNKNLSLHKADKNYYALTYDKDKNPNINEICKNDAEVNHGYFQFLLSPLYILHLDELKDRKSTRLNSSHSQQSRMPSSA